MWAPSRVQHRLVGHGREGALREKRRHRLQLNLCGVWSRNNLFSSEESKRQGRGHLGRGSKVGAQIGKVSEERWKLPVTIAVLDLTAFREGGKPKGVDRVLARIIRRDYRILVLLARIIWNVQMAVEGL